MRTNCPAGYKHQVIMFNRHPIRDQLITHRQTEAGHAGTSQFLPSPRGHNWTVEGNSALRRVTEK